MLVHDVQYSSIRHPYERMTSLCIVSESLCTKLTSTIIREMHALPRKELERNKRPKYNEVDDDIRRRATRLFGIGADMKHDCILKAIMYLPSSGGLPVGTLWHESTIINELEETVWNLSSGNRHMRIFTINWQTRWCAYENAKVQNKYNIQCPKRGKSAPYNQANKKQGEWGETHLIYPDMYR
ncbi:hypothetical protein BJ508DRAFT_311617 [Ascobolus immersus RN42]|uniref:Uncharacterized protein n=1 Tax=Ascobolus immersus RN42 TaxID=1160509 RepID=A0A3N4HVA3_ASCIM|nr:hypothetical protein BJ508DRAFT_311617 [Ascobolus immersus RN42]